MDTSWWLALVAVVLLALVAVLVDGWGRAPRPPGGARRFRGGGTGLRPAPAEIWWAYVVPLDGGLDGRRGPGAGAEGGAPHDGAREGGAGKGDDVREDGAGPREWPCLVLSVRGGRAVVVEISTKYHDERAGVIPLPPGSVGDTRGRASFLQTDEVREVPVRDFRRRVGVVDPVLWDQVRHLAT
ncbi:type II toxin-antitoxin system PemK/MazF family toxin [Streptomyces sp. XM83C]|jgi:hypothetical protein|uniref:Type II toxin-antitoxin system PemK/MazF family toxin n=1 Tax=Streptomyces thermocoprophilus TaxID=78356 RepID=A0ABV5V9M0_9ACTN|nr:type II toxin-antitoxin system PemK/MazF family toxin [Streptomyces sp. XM83C]MCK1820630.1 type II toxin-antitoxin system PemK/MazF family toxin [Streptomyces sp. XM83C]